VLNRVIKGTNPMPMLRTLEVEKGGTIFIL